MKGKIMAKRVTTADKALAESWARRHPRKATRAILGSIKFMARLERRARRKAKHKRTR